MIFEDIEIKRLQRSKEVVRSRVAFQCRSNFQCIEGKYPTAVRAVLRHEASSVAKGLSVGAMNGTPVDHIVTCISDFCVHSEHCVTASPKSYGHISVKMRTGVSRLEMAQLFGVPNWAGAVSPDMVAKFIVMTKVGMHQASHRNGLKQTTEASLAMLRPPSRLILVDTSSVGTKIEVHGRVLSRRLQLAQINVDFSAMKRGGIALNGKFSTEGQDYEKVRKQGCRCHRRMFRNRLSHYGTVLGTRRPGGSC